MEEEREGEKEREREREREREGKERKIIEVVSSGEDFSASRPVFSPESTCIYLSFSLALSPSLSLSLSLLIQFPHSSFLYLTTPLLSLSHSLHHPLSFSSHPFI